jgi:ABC-type dipeptide/oligopeptide/nickel transport system permease subunit
VSYNPENPTQAVLEKTVSGASKILMIAGLFTVFFTLCIGVTVVGFSGMFSSLMQSVTTMAFK